MEIFGFILKAGRLGSSKPEQANLQAKKAFIKDGQTTVRQTDRQIGWLAGRQADGSHHSHRYVASQTE
jgi:hypothetical protein